MSKHFRVLRAGIGRRNLRRFATIFLILSTGCGGGGGGANSTASDSQVAAATMEQALGKFQVTTNPFPASSYPYGSWGSYVYGGDFFAFGDGRTLVGRATRSGLITTYEAFWDGEPAASQFWLSGNRMLLTGSEADPSNNSRFNALFGSAQLASGSFTGLKYWRPGGLFSSPPYAVDRDGYYLVGSQSEWVIVDQAGSPTQSFDLSGILGAGTQPAFSIWEPESPMHFYGLDNSTRLYQHTRSSRGATMSSRFVSLPWSLPLNTTRNVSISQLTNGYQALNINAYPNNQPPRTASILFDATQRPIATLEGEQSYGGTPYFVAVPGTNATAFRSTVMWDPSRNWLPYKATLQLPEAATSTVASSTITINGFALSWNMESGRTALCALDSDLRPVWAKSIAGRYSLMHNSLPGAGSLHLVSQGIQETAWVEFSAANGSVLSSGAFDFPSSESHLFSATVAGNGARVCTLSNFRDSTDLLLLLPNSGSPAIAKLLPKTSGHYTNLIGGTGSSVFSIPSIQGGSLHFSASNLNSIGSLLSCLPSVSLRPTNPDVSSFSVAIQVETLPTSIPSWTFASDPPPLAINLQTRSFDTASGTITPRPICAGPSALLLYPTRKSATIEAGLSSSFTIKTAPSGSLSAPLYLSATSDISGATLQFASNTIYAGEDANLEVSLPWNTLPTNRRVTVTATDGASLWNTTIEIDVLPATPSFALTASPDALTFDAGSSASVTISSSSSGGFNSNIGLSATPAIPGLTYSFAPATIAANGSSVLTFAASDNCPAGTYLIDVVGSSGSMTKIKTVLVIIRSSFRLILSSSSVAVGPSQPATITVTATPLGGFASSIWVSLNPTSLPGLQMSLSSSNLFFGSSVQLTISTFTTQAINQTLQIQGTSGPITSSTPLYISTGGSFVQTARSNTPLSIPDGITAGVSSYLTLTYGQIIQSLSVSTNITHAWRGDLRAILHGPDGTSVVLHDRSGSNADDLTTTYSIATAPAAPLSTFYGRWSAGTWRLQVMDLATPDAGTLNSWSITVNGEKSSTLTGPIPDNNTAGLSSNLSFTEQGIVSSLKVRVGVNHPNSGDLEVALIAPDGTTVLLHNRTGGSADFVPTVYPDLVASSQSLTTFAGRSIAGTWRLRVRDLATGNVGTITGWTLSIQSQ